jgi:hypothetical protein
MFRDGALIRATCNATGEITLAEILCKCGWITMSYQVLQELGESLFYLYHVNGLWTNKEGTFAVRGKENPSEEKMQEILRLFRKWAIQGEDHPEYLPTNIAFTRLIFV